MPGEQSQCSACDVREPLSLRDFKKDAMNNKWLLVLIIDNTPQFILNEEHCKKKHQREN